ncbi:MAG TPA: valine--tRNA ligase [Candidatus Babeliales bacterium]|jgi:valyl-tRNA synthetase|nr:valine--tRNA ligase [Candidatus Babeliales bacterium]
MESHYDHKKSEAAAQSLWQKNHTYDPADNPGPLYTIDTPPPTVSGSLHIGHIFSYTQTDIIARYKRMQGYSVIYPFGFDDNGLPTERFVEKRIKESAYKLGRSAFIERCLAETHIIEEEFKVLWQRMGLSVNWDKAYSTIAASVRRISQASFLDLLRKGYVYRTQEPALYCTTCRTSVAQAELDDREVSSTFNTIIFKDQNGNDLPVATTRPELLPSCVALFFNSSDPRYQHLRGTHALVPLGDFQVPILEDARVIPEKGTGLVMCCTFGDTTDIEWYKTYTLPFKQSIGRDGKFVDGIILSNGISLTGLKVPEARAIVIEELKKTGLLHEQKAIIHSVSVHERCKQEIEYTVLPQWFIRILDYKKELIALADQITWYPAFMKSRYINWVENLKWDWCISRQRFYGIPFPVWHCTSCSVVLPASMEQLPIDPQEQSYPTVCPHCQSTSIVPDTDVMDTWATSALTPYIIAELYTQKPLFFDQNKSSAHSFLPMSMRPQAHDIIRTWAFYTIVRTWMHDQKIPWKDIIISGHVLSSQKEKMSKSQGNTLLPEALLERYCADVIRYWTASASLGHDIPFSENQCKIGQKLITKLWNAFRFIATHSQQAHSTNSPADISTINQWIVHKATECFKRYTTYFDVQEFSFALDAVEQFFWHDFCDNYIELIKDQLFKPEKYTTSEVAATKWTLAHIGLRILQLYAPFIPHITEILYQEIYAKQLHIQSLHQVRFNLIQTEYIYGESAYIMQRILAIIAQVRKLKSEHALSLKTEVVELKLIGQDTDTLQPYEVLLAGITGAQRIIYEPGILESPELVQRDNLWYGKVSA